MDKGEGHIYKGKSLAEIDIDPEFATADSENSDDEKMEEIDHDTAKIDVMPESPKPSTSCIVSCKLLNHGFGLMYYLLTEKCFYFIFSS